VSNITAIPNEGNKTIEVKLPANNRLMISKPFVITEDSGTSFVFDITVVKAGKSGQYILKPQIGQSGADQEFELIEVPGSWVSPTSSVDPGDYWRKGTGADPEDEAYAYDDNAATYVYTRNRYTGWCPYVELHLSSSITCDKIRFMSDGYKRTQASVDIYYGGSWHEVYSGTFEDDTWKEVTFASQTISAARFRTYQSELQCGLLREFDFWDTGADGG